MEGLRERDREDLEKGLTAMRPSEDLLEPRDPAVGLLKTLFRGVGSLLLALAGATALGFLAHALWFFARFGWGAFPL